jgi:hypothetical protein
MGEEEEMGDPSQQVAGVQSVLYCKDGEGDLPTGLLGGVGPGGCGLPRVNSSGLGRLLWARAWTKLKAINMFRLAGHEAHDRELRETT